ncbi:inositol monophosphatase family protein [Pilimelia columellifera]|uniref:Inositol monophosphatase family protein n=1 Tax=Pilimelia columellifera subsp. columellifera TaxID=706583 RepID=A0ABN3N3J6_9ACTN
MNGAAPDGKKLLRIAVGLAETAAATASRMRAVGVSGVSSKSTVSDIVTAADRAVERGIVAELGRLRPDDAVMGEEYGAAGRAGPVRWIVDPIDGTVNYALGLPYYAVSVAAEVAGVVVAGVVRNPATGDQWTAVRGAGAHKNGRRLTGSTRRELARAVVGTGFGYEADRRAHQGRVVAGLLSRVADIRRFGAAALDLCLTAEGALDAYYEKGLAAWDHAAGGLVAAEAGLTVSGLGGLPAGPTMVMAAPPALHQPLAALLTELDAAGGP